MRPSCGEFNYPALVVFIERFAALFSGAAETLEFDLGDAQRDALIVFSIQNSTSVAVPRCTFLQNRATCLQVD